MNLRIMSKKKEETEQGEKKEEKSEIVRLQLELDDLRAQFENLNNQLKRAVADYQNLEKRIAEGRSELTNFVGAELIKKMLPVLNNLEMVVEGGRQVLSERSESKEWYKGVEMATAQFLNVLKNEGLEQIEADGQFDPTLHEAIDTKDGEDGKILEVVENGYKLRGRIIKPARVVVGRKVGQLNG